MNRRYVIGGLLVVVVVALGIGAAVYTGVGPAPGGGSGEDIDDFPVQEDTGEDGSNATSSKDTDPFTFTIDALEECGFTCRDVTATLYNNQNETETNVTVYIRIFAGENNTDTEDVVWQGKEEVGTMDAGDSYTTIERVELSLREARKIDRNGGWITLLTTVESDDTTVTFKDSEQVA